MIDKFLYVNADDMPSRFPNSYWVSEDGQMYIYVDNNMDITFFIPDDSNNIYECAFGGGRYAGVNYYINICYDDTPDGSFGETWEVKRATDWSFAIITTDNSKITRANNTIVFRRVYGFDFLEYEDYAICMIQDRNDSKSPSEYISETSEYVADNPCTAISIAKSAWLSEFDFDYSKYAPLSVYYDKDNGYWLVKSSYRCLNIFGYEMFCSKSASAIISSKDGGLLAVWESDN